MKKSHHPSPIFPKVNYKIKGGERRNCCQCEWRDLDRSTGDYGVYIGGRYYCVEHAKEFNSRGEKLDFITTSDKISA